MSKSYRQPACSVCGNRSAKQDKRLAARGVRRAQNHALRTFSGDWDDFMMPVRHECHWNETYGWSRDGSQSLQFPPRYPYSWVFLFGQEDADEEYERQIEWYKRLCCK